MPLQAGDNTLTAVATDTLGHVAKDTATVTLDTSRPWPRVSANPTSVNPGCTATSGVWQKTCNDPNFTWSGASDGGSGVAGYDVYWGTSSSGTSPATWRTSASYNPSAVPSNSTYYLRVRTKDNVDNWSDWTPLFTLQYDGQPPLISDTTPANGSVITSAWPVISAALSDPQPGSGVQPLSTTLLLDSQVVTPQVNTANGLAYTPSVRLADGVHSVTAQVYDQAGNQAQSGPWSFTVDDDSASSLGVTKYYFHGTQRVAMRQDDVVYLIHSDHLGSTSLTTDITGTLVAETRYLPYGEERWITGTLVTDFTFTGQRAEAGFRLMDYNARYYDPGLGRFVSADTVVPEYMNPQDLNRYSYVRGNPLSYTDPSGHCIPGVDCPGMMSGVTDPGEAPPGGEAYAKWLVNFISWVEQGQAETGGMLDWGLTQQAAASELSTFLMKDPEMLNELLWQEVAQGASMTGSTIASGTAEFMASGTGAVINMITNRLPRTQRFARAVPERVARDIEAGLGDVYLANPSNPDVFITAAEDLARYRSQSSVERRIALPPGQRAVVTFNYDVEVGGITSPILRNYPEFVGGGLTRGGAREWVIPNRPLNELPVQNIKVRYLK